MHTDSDLLPLLNADPPSGMIQVPAVLARCPDGVKGTDRLLLVDVASRAGDSWAAYTLPELARALGVHRSTALRATRRMAARGLLYVDRRPGERWRFRVRWENMPKAVAA